MSTSAKIVCSICLEGLDGSETEAVALACGHVFDRECIQQCFNVTRTCPICKQRATPSETCRLYFSSDSQSERDDRLTRELKQTVETIKFELSVAREMCQELKDALELTETKRIEVETLHQQALGDCVEGKKENLLLKAANASLEGEIRAIKERQVEEEKKIAAEFATAQGNINKIHTNIAKRLHKEISIKEKQLSNANDKLKRLSAAKSRLEEKLDRLRDEKVSIDTKSTTPKKKFDTENKKNPVEAEDKKKIELEVTMEQRFRNLEKQMLEMKIQNNKKNNEELYNKKKFNKAKSYQKVSAEST